LNNQTIQLDAGIELLSGTMFNYNDPSASDVTIDDIASALSNICRFAGHLPRFYSVAQHALNASLIVDQRYRKCALLHDTAEAFTNDLPTPLKFAVPIFKDLEVSIEAAMATRFGFQYPLPNEVKLADLQMLRIEKEYIKNCDAHWAVLDGIEIENVIHLPLLAPMTPEMAKAAFLQRWEEVRAD
jgi:hypothetical protein